MSGTQMGNLAMKRLKYEMRTQIETYARTFARTGTYGSFRAVEHALLDAGFSEVEHLFKNKWQQREIDRLCHQYFRPDRPACHSMDLPVI
jgi:hypothetical protein